MEDCPIDGPRLKTTFEVIFVEANHNLKKVIIQKKT